jgi:small-conductance mechanosensitive channel
MDMNAYLQKGVNWFLTSGLHIIFILILALIALKAAKMLSKRLLKFVVRQKEDIEFQKRTHTLGSIIRFVAAFGILLVAAMMVLKEFGVEIGPLLAAAGIVGLAVGFGAQSLVKDVISGFFILLEDQIRVGDVVQIAGKGGLVEKINLKTTILRDLAGNVHYVPNGHIDVVTNMTKDYSRYVFDIGVAYREDVDKVIEVIKEVDEELRNDPDYKDDILEPIEILGLDQFADSAVIVKARTTTMPIKQWRVGREFNRRLKKKFDERNIEIPFPHVTLYMGQDKQGQSPPLRIVKEGK